LAIAAYGRYARRPGILRYLAVAALFALGLASKPMVVTLPFVLLLVDFWPLGRVRNWSTPSPAFPIPQASLSWLALEKLPLLGLSAASAVITIIAQRRFNAMPSASVWRLSWRIENAVNGYATYLEKAFFPRGLSPFYPNMTLGVWQVGLAASLLIALSVLIWKLRPGRPYLAIGFLWFLGTLVPVIGIIQVGAQSMADRYTYIPLIGIFVAVVWGVSETARSKAVRIQWMVALSALALILCPVVTWQQLTYWKSSVDLWTRALQVTPSNYVAEENLAVALADLGREDEALPHFEIARQIIPTDPTALLNVGTDYVKQGRLKEAIEAFEIVARTNHDPEHLTAAYRGLGIAYAQSGNRAKARENFILAQQISPFAPTEFYNLARLEAEEGAEKLAAVVSAYPTTENYLQLGQLLHLSGKDHDAEVAYGKALKIDPKSTEAKKALQDLKEAEEPPSPAPSNSFPSGPTGR
jgi:Flp pilus assembly protein TadD